MKVLLLGGSGFIGKVILNELLAQGHEVIATEHRTKIKTDNTGRLTVLKTSIGGINLSRLPFRPDVIVHAARNNASRFGTLGRRIVALKGYIENTRLLKQVDKMGDPARVIYISGSLMYGSHAGKLIDESYPTQPVSFAREYVHAEKPFLKEIDKGNTNVAMVRVPWVIGNGSWFRWNYANIMKDRKIIPLYGKGSNKMTFIDVADIAAGICKLLHSDFSGMLNMYHPTYFAQKDWATLLSGITGLPVYQFNETEMQQFGQTVKEAFETEIALHSKHTELQATLQKEMPPVTDIVKKYLPFMLQDI